MCAGTSWDGVWFPDKHIADRLPAYAPVLYVDPPISRMTVRRNPQLAASLSGPRLRLIRPNLARLTPVVLPGMHRPGMHRVTDVLTRRALRRAVRALRGSVCAVVVASQTPLFGECNERMKVLYATDDFAAAAQYVGIPERRLRRDEAREAREADLVVAISPTLEDKWKALGQRTVLIPNGVDHELFRDTDDAPLPEDVSLPAPVVGFIGHISERIELELLEAIARRGRSLLLVGPRQSTFAIERLNELLARPNVCWVGPKPFESLPSYLRMMDVGITPYGDNAFNRSSFPLKTLEYLAGGRPAVATPLPVVGWLDTDLIATASAPEDFADAVDLCLEQPRSDELIARRKAFAAEHSWEKRAAAFARALGFEEPLLQ